MIRFIYSILILYNKQSNIHKRMNPKPLLEELTQLIDLLSPNDRHDAR